VRFTQTCWLLLAILLPYFAWVGRPKASFGRRRTWAALALRCLIVALIVLSLAGLRTVHGSDELAVVFLVDVSDSISNAEQQRALDFVAEALAAMGPNDQAALVLFGADALVERPMSQSRELGQIASIPLTHQTDLAEAIRLGMALFPGGAARRMVLLSDGNPTVGDSETAIRLARAQGIQVDVVSLGQPPLVEAWISALDLPARLHQGEEFELTVTVESSAQMEGTLTLLAGDHVLFQQAVHLGPGRNRFAIPLVASEPGFNSFRAALTPQVDSYWQNNSLSGFALVEGPPRVLIVSAEEADAAPLLQALQAAGVDVQESTAGAMPSDAAALADYAAVVLVNVPAQRLSPRAMSALQSFVRDLGGGLVAVGGPRSYGVGGWYQTPLEETLPVEMTIDDPQRFPPMSIVVIIDKSGSMGVIEGGVEKIRLAGEAAARVAELINDADEITVIAYDDRPADVIGPLAGSQREEVIDRVIRLQAGGGGIYVRESLQYALSILADDPHTVRHIILLADGSDSEHQEGVAALVESEIAAQNITLSTVAIGYGQDLRFLEQIAELGGGRYHFTNQAANLPEIFAQETQLAMRSYIVEEPFYPAQTASSPILSGIDAVPQLVGYVATTPKPAAQVVLITHQEDPLLATWQYGLGHAVAWTSDATGRWAQQWVRWDGFARFWAQAVRWSMAQQSETPLEMSVSLQGEQAHITVDAVDTDGDFIDEMEAVVNVMGPAGETTPVELAQTAPGRYEGAFTPAAEGTYLLRLSGALADDREVGLTSGWVLGYSPEYAALEADPAYLAYLAGLGGGEMLEEPGQVFVHNLRGAGTSRELWPYLLGLATVLLPFDVGVRRLAITQHDLARLRAWIAERLPRRRRQAVEAPSPIERLFEAKERAGQPPRPQATPPEAIVPPPGPPRVQPPPEATVPPPGPPRVQPSPQPAPPPSTPPPGGETLAGRLLRQKQDRRKG